MSEEHLGDIQVHPLGDVHAHPTLPIAAASFLRKHAGVEMPSPWCPCGLQRRKTPPFESWWEDNQGIHDARGLTFDERALQADTLSEDPADHQGGAHADIHPGLTCAEAEARDWGCGDHERIPNPNYMRREHAPPRETTLPPDPSPKGRQ